MDQAALIDHQFVVAAYTITWVLQLGYLAWLVIKWRAEKRNAEGRERRMRSFNR
jgi:threonine/homoserine/homoserine lactone efflux protein